MAERVTRGEVVVAPSGAAGVAARRDRYARIAGSGLGALLTCLVASNGLVFPAYAPDVQVGVLAGLVAGSLAPDALSAALAAASGALVAAALQPAGSPPAAAAVATTLAAAALVAALVAYGLSAGAVRRALPAVLAVVIIVGNLFLTASAVAPLRRQGGAAPSTFEVLEKRPARGELLGDSGFYRNVVWRMRDGVPYYRAYREAWADTWTSPPSSVFGVRQPTFFALWAVLPGWPRSAFFAFLLFAAAAVAAAPIVSSRAVVSPAVAVFGSAAIGAYMLRFAIEPGLLFLQEQWVGALAVVVFAAYALAQDDARHRRWMAVAATLAALAMMLRELMVFVLLAGLAAALLGSSRHRRFDVAAWGGALAVALAYWGIHASRASAVFARTADPTAWVGNAGVSNLVHGLTDSTVLLNAHAWVPIALAALGVAGALAQPDRQFRIFASAAVLMPLAGFLFLGNGAADLSHMTASNYWGAIVMPALMALAPSSFALFTRRHATTSSAEVTPVAATAAAEQEVSAG